MAFQRVDAAAWTSACATYHTAVKTYAQVLRIKRMRLDGGAPARDQTTQRTTAQPASNGAATRAASCLTARERQVSELLMLGLTNQQIADQLVITRGTAANHVANILAKLGVANRTQVVATLVASER